MKIVARCSCGFEWGASHGARQVQVLLVTPEYVPPCQKCGKRGKQTVTITQERDDTGTLEIRSTGDRAGTFAL